MPNRPDGYDTLKVYERQADAYDRDRDRTLFERAWLDRFIGLIPAGGHILDLGCGTAEPIAAYLIASGFGVTGIDGAEAMIAKCRKRFPDQTWLSADMRKLDLGRAFHGIIAWDSFFHLPCADQRQMFGTFTAHAHQGTALLFTSGTEDGEAWGQIGGEPVFHGSLSPEVYRTHLAAHGWRVEAYRESDPQCGGHTVWLAKKADPAA